MYKKFKIYGVYLPPRLVLHLAPHSTLQQKRLFVKFFVFKHKSKSCNLTIKQNIYYFDYNFNFHHCIYTIMVFGCAHYLFTSSNNYLLLKMLLFFSWMRWRHAFFALTSQYLYMFVYYILCGAAHIYYV